MICKCCEEGYIYIKQIITVSHDMAVDAGDLSLEGEAWDWSSEQVECSCCRGDWENCSNC